MKTYISYQDRIEGALWGMFIGDALAMPAHWYYDTKALRRDYGEITEYLQPHNPHPDSILWRSSYRPVNRSSDILHDQAQYWGVRDVHYHQFLQAGENTLNVKLARQLLLYVQREKSYVSSAWLERMIAFLTTPGSHRDTYVEEYLRYFFINYGKGMQPGDCGRSDEQHIGGYSLMLPLVIAYAQSPGYAVRIGLEHLSLTHGGAIMAEWGRFLNSTLLNILDGHSFQESVRIANGKCKTDIDVDEFIAWTDYPDSVVVGKHFSSACYIDQAVPATIYLAQKYSNFPEQALIANTMCGGDNAGRGAVMGALLGALHGVAGWPARWVDGLLNPPPTVQLKY